MPFAVPKAIRPDLPRSLTLLDASASKSVTSLHQIRSQPGWQYQLPTAEDPGSVWHGPPGAATRVLDWCPEVLARLVSQNEPGNIVSEFYTVRVRHTLVTLADSQLTAGHGWADFPDVDLWACLTAREQLCEIVRSQARRLSRIAFPEISK